VKQTEKMFLLLCRHKYLRVPKYPIPDVIPELHKTYIDCDVMNAYHQMPIATRVARLLSLQTPFGQFEPNFMPEGASPASMDLMAVMRDIFKDYLAWMVVIHDNMLILFKTFETSQSYSPVPGKESRPEVVQIDLWGEEG
jgi:hypothetical protein